MIIKCILIGLFLAVLDIIPMIKNRLDQYSIASAFVFHCIMPFILYRFSAKNNLIVNGTLLYFCCAIPIILLVLKEDKKAAPIILITSTCLGLLSGFLLKSFY